MDLIKFKVTGVVQGVCFRYYTQKEATRLGIRGWCHNHPDESVEGVALGHPEEIAKFKVFLWRGPPSAEVSKVVIDETKDVDVASGEVTRLDLAPKFEIRRFRR
ncbi:uncharacterized protein EHS24_007186 [Apiotrichum porosum]|uniref:acylphosphatase n=1 Tax=Apiotrichum porosum TaxID=105984 RepID=A0A427XXD7_9TREE|nr:uncharacterized protein EHS24_007186 [Apiotrichum porosum]RSH83500.1 hypothetical protein EHS24_007186 [Apiotrichum porosum]